jgi:hypothetical protein
MHGLPLRRKIKSRTSRKRYFRPPIEKVVSRTDEKSQTSKLKVKQKGFMDDTVTVDVMSSRIVLKGNEVENDDLEKEKWKKRTLSSQLVNLSGIFLM